MLVCPDCNHSLVSKKVKTHSGGRIEIDQCLFCGGIWFDHFEANQVSLPEIKKLYPESVEGSLKSQKTPNLSAGRQALSFGEGKCPHCLVSLVPLQSESIPHYLNVFACPSCRGNWFSQKDLLEFKVAQKVKIDYFKSWRLPLPSMFAVLLPVLILTVLTLSIPVTMIGLKDKARRQEISIKAEEIIIKPTVINLNSTSVIITWATTQPVASKIKYWTETLKPKSMIVSEKLVTNHTIELKNLTPGTFYFYQLLLKDSQGRQIPSELYSFAT